MKELTGDNSMTSNIKGIVTKTSTYYDFVCGYYNDTVITGRYTISSDAFTWYKHPTRAEVDSLNSKMGDVRFYFYRGTNTEIELPATTNIGIIFIQSGNSGNIYTRYATTLVKYTANENNNVTFTMSGDNTISRTGNGIVRILYVYIP